MTCLLTGPLAQIQMSKKKIQSTPLEKKVTSCQSLKILLSHLQTKEYLKDPSKFAAVAAASAPAPAAGGGEAKKEEKKEESEEESDDDMGFGLFD